MRQVGMQIGAERRLGTATFESVDPYTGEPWAVLHEAAMTGGTRDPFVLG